MRDGLYSIVICSSLKLDAFEVSTMSGIHVLNVNDFLRYVRNRVITGCSNNVFTAGDVKCFECCIIVLPVLECHMKYHTVIMSPLLVVL